MNEDVKTKVKVFKALADETRLAIVLELAKHKTLTCGELSKLFPLSQPTLSHHFNKLIAVDVINANKNATHMIYSLNKTYLKQIGFTF
ncbi:helix-turn-helix transcriptional regulator [Candidatus Roizmanbacteria bacterium]|nr:helix-turn-helix transcriptional regulator [Candidatus Roizmanbacteria bacterium]